MGSSFSECDSYIAYMSDLITKGWLNPKWKTIQGDDDETVDVYGAIPNPTPEDLIKCNEDTVFSCVDWIAKSVAKTDLKILVKTYPGQQQPKSYTIPYRVKSKQLKNSQAEIREVIDHRSVDLLNHPNPKQSKYDFLYYLDSQLSLVGEAFVFIQREEYKRLKDQDYNNEGLPDKLYPLLTQFVEPLADDHGQLAGYSYKQSTPELLFKAEDVIHFKFVNPNNPYGCGYSPVRACYERILLGKNELAYLLSLFRNQARPDSIIQVKGGSTGDQLERFQKEMNQRFRQGGIGGVWAIDADDIDVKPLGWSPKDMFGTEIYKWTKLQIINAFSLCDALFDSSSSNRAVATEARRSSQEKAIEPRLQMIQDKINHQLLPEFDERLVCEFDSPIEEDKDFDLQLVTTLGGLGALTKNEVREKFGYDKMIGGSMVIAAPGNVTAHSEAQAPVSQQQPEADDKPDDEEDTASSNRSLESERISTLQTAVYAGQLPRSAAIANVEIMFGLSHELASALFPEVQVSPQPQPPQAEAPAKPQPPQAPEAKQVKEGNSQSGNYGHAGVEGEVGGSAPGGSGSPTSGSPEAKPEDHKQAEAETLTRWQKVKNAALVAIHKVSELVGSNFDAVLDDAHEHVRNQVSRGFQEATGSPVSYAVAAKIASTILSAAYSKITGRKSMDESDKAKHEEAVKLMIPIIRQLMGLEDENPEEAEKKKMSEDKPDDPLGNALSKLFSKYGKLVLNSLPQVHKHKVTPIPDWTEEMRHELTPIIRVMFDNASEDFRMSFGGDTELPLLPIPKLKAATDKLVLDLADSTLATTSQQVEEALENTRQAIHDGLDQGEANNQLTARVKDIFEELSTQRAYLIAETESSRVKHASELATAQESGLDMLKEWLPDSMACPICLGFAQRGAIPLDEPFGKIGEGSYSVIMHCPGHVSCRCSLTYKIEGY